MTTKTLSSALRDTDDLTLITDDEGVMLVKSGATIVILNEDLPAVVKALQQVVNANRERDSI